jgi:hypothetical protein
VTYRFNDENKFVRGARLVSLVHRRLGLYFYTFISLNKCFSSSAILSIFQEKIGHAVPE